MTLPHNLNYETRWEDDQHPYPRHQAVLSVCQRGGGVLALSWSIMNQNLWDVLVLFLIPIGGGIPAGVVLADQRGLPWIVIAGLYFVSDVILACAFEPLMLLFMRASRTSKTFAKIRLVFSRMMELTIARHGHHPGPFTLITITFGSDPMTGRSIAKAFGHGFWSGWALTIAGDMLFFLVIMASTLWLNHLLGNGTAAVVIILVLMIALPPLVKKLRLRLGRR